MKLPPLALLLSLPLVSPAELTRPATCGDLDNKVAAGLNPAAPATLD